MYGGNNGRNGSFTNGEVELKGRQSRRMHYSYLVVSFFVLMAVALVYVWSHVEMTKLEYKYAAEIGTKERLLREQSEIKAELAMLKSPRRIETVARGSLGLIYPERDQIVFK